MTPAYATETGRSVRERKREKGRERAGKREWKIGKRNEIGNCSCTTQTDNLHIIDCSPQYSLYFLCVCVCLYLCVCSYHCRLNGIYMHAFVLATCKMKIYAHLMVAFGPAAPPPTPSAGLSTSATPTYPVECTR